MLPIYDLSILIDMKKLDAFEYKCLTPGNFACMGQSHGTDLAAFAAT